MKTTWWTYVEDLKREFLKQAKFQSQTIQETAKKIAKRFPELDVKQIEKAIFYLYAEHDGKRLLSQTERASEARANLEELNEKASALAACIRKLGLGAFHVMNDRTGIEEVLFQDAEPEKLPYIHPWSKDELHPRGARDTIVCHVGPDGIKYVDEEHLRGGRWVIRLEALANLAAIKAEQIKNQYCHVGRTPMGKRLFGDDKQKLAENCVAFLNGHGVDTQAKGFKTTVDEMVNAILSIEKGEKVGDGVGRKAARRIRSKPSQE